MEVICDTHIWYLIGSGEIPPADYESVQLVGNYINITEFGKTRNLVNRLEYTRCAIQALMSKSSFMEFASPPKYLRNWDDPTYNYSNFTDPDIQDILRGLKMIANGSYIVPDKVEGYIKHCEEKEQDIISLIETFQRSGEKVRKNINNKKQHWALDSIPSIREFMSFMVSVITKCSGLSNNFKWNRFELFEQVHQAFNKEVELGHRKFKPHDWADLMLLLYVHPGNKVWTTEDKWIYLITKVGMEHYLYKPN